MKLVSAARLRRAQEALLNARPYHESLKRVADSLLGSAPDAMAPAENARRVVLILVITSDRALCGGYNANLLRMAEETARRCAAEGLEPKFFAVGRKGLEHFRRSKAPLDGDRINNTPRLATVGLARDLAAKVITEFRAGAISEAGVVYSAFRSAISQRPTYDTPPAGPTAAAGPRRQGRAADRIPD